MASPAADLLVSYRSGTEHLNQTTNISFSQCILFKVCSLRQNCLTGSAPHHFRVDHTTVGQYLFCLVFPLFDLSFDQFSKHLKTFLFFSEDTGPGLGAPLILSITILNTIMNIDYYFNCHRYSKNCLTKYQLQF